MDLKIYTFWGLFSYTGGYPFCLNVIKFNMCTLKVGTFLKIGDLIGNKEESYDAHFLPGDDFYCVDCMTSTS